MIRLNNVFEYLISTENINLAANKAMKGKRRFKEVQYFIANRDKQIQKIREMIESELWVPSPYRTKIIYEPKKRLIYSLPFFPDRIIHHMIMNILEPFYIKKFIPESYACIKGRGIHIASEYIQKQVNKYQYCLKCDISKFYPSVNHYILFKILQHKIKDERLLNLIWSIIDTTNDNHNIPIGNYLSQWFGNIYLNELDQFVKKELKWKSYLRYCDDFAFFGDDKKELLEVKKKVEQFIHNKLELTFSKAEIFPVSHGVDFLGYRHFKGYKILRKKMLIRFKKRIKEMKTNKFDIDKCKYFSCVINSYLGWMTHCISESFIKKYNLLDLREFFMEHQNIKDLGEVFQKFSGFLEGTKVNIKDIFDKPVIVTDFQIRTVDDKSHPGNKNKTVVIQFYRYDDINKTLYITFTRSYKILGFFTQIDSEREEYLPGKMIITYDTDKKSYIIKH